LPLARSNRFIAYVQMAGRTETVHVKNTGRCREVLPEGAQVFLEAAGNFARKTKYDLVAVKRDGRIVNMDSAAPNRAVGEWLENGGLFSDMKYIRPETKYGSSRFDFYVQSRVKKFGGRREKDLSGDKGCDAGAGVYIFWPMTATCGNRE